MATLNKCWGSHRQRSCLSALSSMLLLDESQQFPGRTQVVFLWFFLFFFFFFFVTPPPPLLFSVPSCFPVTDHSFSLPCAGAPYSVASKVHQERSLTCYLLGRDGNGWIVRVLQCLLVWWSGYEEEALSFFVLLILKTLVIGHSGSGCYYFCCCLYCNAAKVIFSKRGGSCLTSVWFYIQCPLPHPLQLFVYTFPQHPTR